MASERPGPAVPFGKFVLMQCFYPHFIYTSPMLNDAGCLRSNVTSFFMVAMQCVACTIASAETPPDGRPTKAVTASEPDYLATKHQLLEWTISPNGRYGIVIIDPEIEEVPHARTFLVRMKPRRVIATLPKSELPAEDKVHLKTTWSKNSSVVLVDCGHASNANDVQLLELRGDRVIRQTDLLAPIQKQFEASFRKSGAPPIHESIPFHGRGHPDEWSMDANATRVKVRVYAESGTREDEAPWRRLFRGVWSIGEGKWLSQRLTDEDPL
jgi:hypothetical protein